MNFAPRSLLNRLPALLFVCGFIAGAWDFRHASTAGFGQGFEMAAIARNLVSHQGFANPYEPFLTGPTAANPPLYPLFLAALLKLLSVPHTVVAAILINIVLNAACAALMPRVSRLFFDNPLPGAIAGFLWIPAMRLMPQWDVTATNFGLLVFCLLAARDWEQSRSGARAGLVGGLVSLLNPSTVLIMLPWIAFLPLWRRAAGRRTLRFVAVAAATLACCQLPWIARNYATWRAPVIRTNFGHTLYSSNNDCAESSLYRNIIVGCFDRTNPVSSETEARRIAALGEPRYDRVRTAEALAWIRAHPARFRELTLARVVEFWFPDPGPAPLAVYTIWLITALSLPGIFLMVRRREPPALYILTIWLVYPLLYYVVASDGRYRYPLLWTSLLPAGYGLASLFPPRARKTLK